MTTTEQQRRDPARVGDYELLAPLGEGGMGIVHLARKGDGPRVALKVLRPHVVGDSEARRRLAQEVRALGRVDSPRIAPVLDADPHGPTPFVVTRYVPGFALQRYVEEEGVLRSEALRHFADCLAEALEAVHAVGVLHRDVKPSNVLMEGRSPVLIDFGLARAAEDPKLTMTGFMLGTPGYLPPEVLYGEEATTASDVYAWAATTAFAATGRPPFGSGHAMAVLDRVRRGEHDLLDVPRPMRQLLGDCLSVEPHQRPTLREVRAELDGPRGVHPGDGWTHPVVAEPQVERTAVLSVAQPHAVAGPLPDRGERALRVVQRLALGLLVVAAVTFAPYVTFAVLACLVALLRTASVTRQRHRRRRDLRGRARWFDVPTTTLSLPGYLLLGAGGAVLLLGFAGLLAAGAAASLHLAGKPDTTAALGAGAVLVPALWWGPGSARVREMLDPLVVRTSRVKGRAGAVVALCVLLATTGLLAARLQGVTWTPASLAPWS